MRRGILVGWHAVSFTLAACLYFFFVLPRWPELMGQTSHTLGVVLRIGAGVLVAAAALPVVFDLVKQRRPEFGTPQLSLTLHFWSIVGHVLAGVLIAGASIAEIWVSLDASGPILFGIYGGAAAIAVLAALCFYLAFAAETAPPAPKPLKPKKDKNPRAEAAGKTADSEGSEDAVEETEAPADETDSTDTPAETGGLRNRRPSSKTRGSTLTD
jgi:hypothetical protein